MTAPPIGYLLTGGTSNPVVTLTRNYSPAASPPLMVAMAPQTP